jgi:hypothetical protein
MHMYNHDKTGTSAKLAAIRSLARVEGQCAANNKLGLALDLLNPMKIAEFNQFAPEESHTGYSSETTAPAPAAATPSLWEQYKTPLMLAGGALAAGYGLHHYQKADEAANALNVVAQKNKLDAARSPIQLNIPDNVLNAPPQRVI